MKTKNKDLVKLTVIFIFLLITSSLFAQQGRPNDGMNPPPNHQGHDNFKKHKMMPVDSLQAEIIFDHFSKAMSLNKKQKKKLNAVFLNHFKQIEELQEKEKAFMDKMREKHFNLKKEFESSIEKELDKKQIQKFKEFEKGKHRPHKGEPRK